MKNKKIISSNIDITKIILLIIIVVGFGVIIYFVAKYFKETCPEGSHFDTKYNSCVKNCPPGLIVSLDGNDCVCPTPGDDILDGKCVPKCKEPNTDLCGTTCYNSAVATCIDEKVCPASLICGDKCMTPGFTCSGGAIVFDTDDKFLVTEGDKSYNITVPKGSYRLDNQVFENQKLFQNVLSDLLTTGSNSNGKKYKYNVKSDSNKLIFNIGNEVTDNTTSTTPAPKDPQPIFNFKISKYPEKFGFDKDVYNFDSDILTSVNEIDTNTLIETKCEDVGKELCGFNCCDKGKCVNGECCDERDGLEICPENQCCMKKKDGTSSCCGKICCDPEKERCQDGKCLTICEFKDKDGKEVLCDTTDNIGSCINVINNSDPSNPINMSYCGSINCRFLAPNPEPDDIRDIPVCKDPNGKFYSKYVANKRLSRNTVSVPSSGKCVTDNCISKSAEIGVDNINATVVNGNLTNCVANFSCQRLLAINGDNCPFSDKQKCCYSSPGVFTGQVCPDKYNIAYMDVKTGNCECIKGWGSYPVATGTICKIVKDETYTGTLYSNKDECLKINKCNFGYSGDNCDIFTKESVTVALNKTFQTIIDPIANYIASINYVMQHTFLIILPSNNTKKIISFPNIGGGFLLNNNNSTVRDFKMYDLLALIQNMGGIIIMQESQKGVGGWFGYSDDKPPCDSTHTYCNYIDMSSKGTLNSITINNVSAKNYLLIPNLFNRTYNYTTDQAFRVTFSFLVLG
jgi:hypothetical protein